ncbi:hypothetical protein HPB52_012257 [Rhipicephalus sanguineus]|uniref:Uncharacterized protein n=1 Tax=Rhipicephalus sanguineus TaxID=34632 RepID=A0A9D4SYT2_RHISA|nr:hypothetical protein HPB52_012257 [Rhipicephalus sanguineus]
MCACMCRAVPTRKTTAAREARSRGRAGVGFRGVLLGLKGTAPRRRNPRVIGSSRRRWRKASRVRRRDPAASDFVTAVREVRRSRQDYLVWRLAHRYDPGHVATLPPAEWTAQPPLDDRSRRADAGFLNLPLAAGLQELTPGSLTCPCPAVPGGLAWASEPYCWGSRAQLLGAGTRVSSAPVIDGGAKPPEFDAATLRPLTSSLQVTALQPRRLRQ